MNKVVRIDLRNTDVVEMLRRSGHNVEYSSLTLGLDKGTSRSEAELPIRVLIAFPFEHDLPTALNQAIGRILGGRSRRACNSLTCAE